MTVSARTPRSTSTARWLGAALGTGLVLVAGCTDRPTPAGTFRDPGPSAEFRLVSFDSCDQAAQQLRAAARASVGPWGFGTGGRALADDAATAAEEADGAAPAPAAPDAARAPAPGSAPGGTEPGTDPGTDPDRTGPGYSGTNVHESGVDEPDLVKTDGRRIVTVSNGTLRVVDAQRRVETGTLSLRPPGPDGIEPGRWQPSDLLLHGDRALVLLSEGWWGGAPVPDLPGAAAPGVAEPGVADPAAPDQPATTPGSPTPEPIVGPRLLLVDLTGGPHLVSEYTVDGGLVDARAVDGIARVVVRSGPRIDFPQPSREREQRDEAARLAANREVVESAELADWLPRYEVTTAGSTDTGQVDCTAVSRPARYSGTSMLTVLTFDLAAASGLGDGAPVSVVADGNTVYSNGTSLYVASDQRWQRILPQEDGQPEVDDGTDIYKFDTSQPGPPRYAAAGSVEGWLLNQYAMSEWEGHLRVATTTEQSPDGQGSSESTVYVLAEREGKLVETGSVGGLGRTERIYSVRFTGPVGYLVTFRETDPLYAVDLRDPTAPAVRGELKVTGYSAYLHPLGDGRLVGVGQEADRQGRIQGTQVSMFDVADLAEPTLLDKHEVRFGRSEAEFDPHAFLWWPPERLLVIPLTVADWEGGGELASGALVLRVDDAGFTELARISHPEPDGGQQSPQIRRSLVVGDTLWTVSHLGLQANDLSTLERSAWIGF